MIKRLRKRFIRIAMLAVTAVLLLLSIIVNAANFISTNNELTQLLVMISENQGDIPDMPRDGSQPDDKPGGSFNQETPYSTRYFVLRYDADGVLTQANLDNIAAVTEADTDDYLSIARAHGDGFGYTAGYKYYVLQTGEERYMAIFLDCHQELHSLSTIALLSLIATGICIALVYVIVVLFSKKAIDPVVQSSRQQKQFITDASHELKTPITVIATCLKVLELETGKQKWIDKAQAQTEKLKELVNALVTLSRMDEEDSPLHFQSFPLSEAIGETADSFTDYAASLGHTLNIEIMPELTCCGDEYAIRQLVSILLDNAVKYAAPDTGITISLKKSKREIVIQTINVCASLDTTELNRLFDRFYRPDASRTSGTGGFGIGLSIARSIAEGHRGTIQANSPDGRTIVFTVRFPQAR